MPIKHAIVHLIEKKPDGTPAVLHARDAELGDSQAIENLLADLNESYNAKNKAWGFFQGESGAYPFSGWLGEYLEGDRDFVGFSREAVEHLQKLMEESNLSTGGHVLFAHYQQGMTDYLAIALLHHSEGVAVNESTERLQGVVIENRDALALMEYHDRPNTLHYVDPPYVHSTRSTKVRHNATGKSYRYELDDNQHKELAAFLKRLRGMVVLSGYPCPLYDELYSTWHRVDRHAYADGSRERIECLWLNSAALEGLAQLDFFQASNASPSPSFQTTVAQY
ncbi:TPA: nucleoid-associated protein [Pseudomonas aeruginosa]